LAFLRDGTISAGGDEQVLAPVKVGKKDTSNCDIPGGCGLLHTTDSNGNEKVGIPFPEGKTKSDYPNK